MSLYSPVAAAAEPAGRHMLLLLKDRSAVRVPSVKDLRGWHLEVCVSNTIWTFRVPSHAFWFDKSSGSLYGFNESGLSVSFRSICRRFHRRYSHLLENPGRTRRTPESSSANLARPMPLCETGEMWILDDGSQVLGSYCLAKRNSCRPLQGGNGVKLGLAPECDEDQKFPRIG